ncbi:MAG: molybdate ABC transporter substrate-binding protein [Alphaproteobacteria bacterium]|jgi:molybdate transport system substrate-binding protein|nr:molybdate ABC transporter substrate-binding protein [Alphaproteobacteria bacterium]
MHVPAPLARLLAAAVLLSLGALSDRSPAVAEDAVTVFAAASLTDAVTTILDAHEAATGQPIRLSFAASSTLARQIEAGAPAQIYLSANERWMDYVADLGLIAPDTRVSPIGNALVLIAPADTPLDTVTLDAETDWADLLRPGERIAIADPDHTPVGLYARESMESLGLWETARDRLARTAEVRAALALVETGEAPLGIVYATDAAVSDRVTVIGRFPEDSHTPISYPFAIVADQNGPAVRAVYEALLGDDAQAVFAAAGFTLR